MIAVRSVFFASLLSLISPGLWAASYSVPTPDHSLIGQTQYTSTEDGSSVLTVAQHYDLGFNAIAGANPQLNMNRKFTPHSLLKVPTQHLLPDAPRRGIIINLPEMRMYYYPENSGKVLTYPIGIGKIGKTIPILQTHVVRKVKDPIWTPTENIRKFNLEQGIVLPIHMPAGPDNPLGPYAIYTKIPTYLMHSTIFPESIGKRASFGCIRMFQPDIESFFPLIQRGIPIDIINSPITLGWENNHLYMQAFEPLEEHEKDQNNSLPGVVHSIVQLTENQSLLVDWQVVAYIKEERDGVPHDIGIKLP